MKKYREGKKESVEEGVEEEIGGGGGAVRAECVYICARVDWKN